MAEFGYTSAPKLARAFDISQRRLHQLAAEGVIPHSVRGRGFPVFECVVGYVKFLRKETKEVPADRAGSEARLKSAQADLRELELAKKRGELIDAGELSHAIMAAGQAVTSGLDALPGRLANKLARALPPAKVKKLIQDEVRRVRAQMVARLRPYCGGLEAADGDPGAAAGQERGAVGGREPGIAAGERGAGAVPVEPDPLHDPDHGAVP